MSLPKSMDKITATVLSVILLSILCSCNQTEDSVTANDDYYIAAYVWPSCHAGERNTEVLWPEGIGEWEIIKQGTPRFEGHYQPKVPLWGYEMDDDPAVMEKWIDTATDYGVNVFIFDWYWFDGAPFLESSLNNGFLKAKNSEKMHFYMMWANHDVRKNYWNVYKYKDDTSLLWDGAVDMENFRIIVERVISQYFDQPNYFRIDDKPVFSIFSIHNLIEGFGSLEETKKALEYFRAEVKSAGFPGLHIQLIGNGAPRENLVENIEYLGVNSITKYNWGGPHPEDYIQWGVEAADRREQWDAALNIPFFPNVSIGWDDTPRFPEKGRADVVHYNNPPESFAAAMQKAKVYADNHPEQPKLITIFSWNEWVEGSYLLPDMKHGFQHLEQVKKVMHGGYEPYEIQ